nr:immunoglobulin heavy chain junction region [Homo sapiens]
ILVTLIPDTARPSK